MPHPLHARLAQAQDPLTEQPLGASLVQLSEVEPGQLRARVVLAYVAQSQQQWLSDQLTQRLSLAAEQPVTVELSFDIKPRAVNPGTTAVAGVKNMIAVASGKGGVGKSTLSVNLALALSREGARVGVLDADIYGPSVPTLLGQHGQPETDGQHLKPLEAHGLWFMSIGLMVASDQAVVWRAPMVHQALEQMLRQTTWPELDYLIVDLPPGTGDIQLSLVQRTPLAAALLVSTPQEVAVADVRRGYRMFEKLRVPVLGVVDNMSHYQCPSCGHREPIFGSGGSAAMAEQFQLELLASIPLDTTICQQSDRGHPIVAAYPQHPASLAYSSLARRISVKLAQLALDRSSKLPKIVISPT